MVARSLPRSLARWLPEAMYRREKSLALKGGSAAALYNNLSVLAPRAKPLAHFAAVQGSAVQLVSASADGLSCSHRHLHAKEGGLAALGGTAPHAAAAATIITQVRAPPGAGWESRTGRDAEAAGGSSVWPDRPAGLAGRGKGGSLGRAAGSGLLPPRRGSGGLKGAGSCTELPAWVRQETQPDLRLQGWACLGAGVKEGPAPRLHRWGRAGPRWSNAAQRAAAGGGGSLSFRPPGVSSLPGSSWC